MHRGFAGTKRENEIREMEEIFCSIPPLNKTPAHLSKVCPVPPVLLSSKSSLSDPEEEEKVAGYPAAAVTVLNVQQKGTPGSPTGRNEIQERTERRETAGAAWMSRSEAVRREENNICCIRQYATVGRRVYSRDQREGIVAEGI